MNDLSKIHRFSDFAANSVYLKGEKLKIDDMLGMDLINQVYWYWAINRRLYDRNDGRCTRNGCNGHTFNYYKCNHWCCCKSCSRKRLRLQIPSQNYFFYLTFIHFFIY